MRYGLRARLYFLVACSFAAVGVACSKMAPCDVSPVEIEELKEDISVLDADLAAVQERVKRLSDDLVAKQADLEAKKPKPDELRRRLEELKRGSGRTEKKPTDSATAGTKKESS